MKPPSSFSFALAVGRGASARGRRPSLRRSSWPGRGNRLSRSAATLAETRPSLGPSGEPTAPTGNVARKADPVSFLTSSQGASDLKAEIGEVRRARATDSSPECNAPASAGA
jgi:hypothetical protein